MACCNIVYNSEILLNESHTNNFVFVLDNIPISFLLSKFSLECIDKSMGPSPSDLTRWGNIEAIKESNNDVRNLSLYLSGFTFPGVNIETTTIEHQLATIKTVNGKLSFNDLTTTFVNDENWFIYRMFLYWLYAGHNPEELMKFTQDEHTNKFYTNGHLILLDNNRDKLMEWTFYGLHPKSIGDIAMDYKTPNKINLSIGWIYTDFIPSDDYQIFKKV